MERFTKLVSVAAAEKVRPPTKAPTNPINQTNPTNPIIPLNSINLIKFNNNLIKIEYY